MGLILIIQTIIISLVSGILIKTFWISYILLITILRGILVLFIYISSIASNEKFQNKINLWIISIILTITRILFLILGNKIIIKNNYLRLEINPLRGGETLFLNKIFNIENISITIMLVIYLLYTIIVSTQLVNIFEGPIRKKN